jgi:hypothetical protein
VKRVAAILMVALVVPSCATDVEQRRIEQGSLILESQAFRDGGQIPTPYTCDGPDSSPDLTWNQVPDGTIEIAIEMVDIDANLVHWVAWGLPPTTQSIALDSLPPDAKQAANSFGRRGYAGPCPPPRKGPHRYVFTVVAMRGHIALPDGAPANDALRTVGGLRLAQGAITGFYERD